VIEIDTTLIFLALVLEALLLVVFILAAWRLLFVWKQTADRLEAMEQRLEEKELRRKAAAAAVVLAQAQELPEQNDRPQLVPNPVSPWQAVMRQNTMQRRGSVRR